MRILAYLFMNPLAASLALLFTVSEGFGQEPLPSLITGGSELRGELQEVSSVHLSRETAGREVSVSEDGLVIWSSTNSSVIVVRPTQNGELLKHHFTLPDTLHLGALSFRSLGRGE